MIILSDISNILFAKIVNLFKLITIFAKSSIVDVQLGFIYASTHPL